MHRCRVITIIIIIMEKAAGGDLQHTSTMRECKVYAGGTRRLYVVVVYGSILNHPRKTIHLFFFVKTRAMILFK